MTMRHPSIPADLPEARYYSTSTTSPCFFYFTVGIPTYFRFSFSFSSSSCSSPSPSSILSLSLSLSLSHQCLFFRLVWTMRNRQHDEIIMMILLLLLSSSPSSTAAVCNNIIYTDQHRLIHNIIIYIDVCVPRAQHPAGWLTTDVITVCLECIILYIFSSPRFIPTSSLPRLYNKTRRIKYKLHGIVNKKTFPCVYQA